MRARKTLHVACIGLFAAAVLLAAGPTNAAEQTKFAPATPDVRRSELPSREEILSPRLSELEHRLFAQIHDGGFGKFSLLEAGLIAGGVERGDELLRYRKRFDSLVESARRAGKVAGSPRQQAQALFEYLHQSVLRGGYDLQASDLRQALEKGRFNCVTATLLFNCLAHRFELKAVGLQIPGHAMSRLEFPDEILDVETTCPRWFTMIGRHGTTNSPLPDGLPRKAMASADRLEVADLTTSANTPSDRRPLRPISDAQLVATIYYNRGVDFLARKHFAAAAAANAKAVRLDPENTTAKGNFLATINNWAIELGTGGEYEKAAELFKLGMATDPGYRAFHSNYVELVRQWSERLCRGGRYEDAARLLSEAAQEQPNEKFFHEAAIEVLRRWAKKPLSF
jgi:tetratricopeptide (TPR) repeat protein